MNQSLKPINKQSNVDGKTITKINIGKSKVTIYFDDEKINITPNTYTEYRLFVGKALKDSDIKELTKFNDLDSYIKYCVNLLSKSEISEEALKDKLLKKGAKKGQISAVIKKMNEYSFLDDKALIKDLLSLYDYKHFGKYKIIKELRKKKIKEEDISKIKFEYKNEVKKAKEYLPTLERKYSKYNYEMRKSHIYNAYLSYGYDDEVIKEVTNSIKDKDFKDELNKLKADYEKIYKRYIKKYDKYEAKNKTISYLMSKGYKYSDIVKIKG